MPRRDDSYLKKKEGFPRYEFPIVKNRDGQDNSIDPDFEIYSGLMKRTARETGHFIPENLRPGNIDETVRDGHE